MSLSKNVSFSMYREVLLLYSFIMMRTAALIREKYNIFTPIDPNYEIDYNIPLTPGGIVSNLLEFKNSPEVSELADRLGISYKNFIGFVLNNQLPKPNLDNYYDDILETRLIPVFSSRKFNHGLYIKIDDELSDKALIQLKKIAKQRYPNLFGKSKRMQTVADTKHAVFYEVNQVMKKVWNERGSGTELDNESHTTLFREALEEYTGNYFDKIGKPGQMGKRYTKKLEYFRQCFIKAEKAYMIPNLDQMSKLLVLTTHKP